MTTNSHILWILEDHTNISAGQVSHMGCQYITSNLNQNSRMGEVRWSDNLPSDCFVLHLVKVCPCPFFHKIKARITNITFIYPRNKKAAFKWWLCKTQNMVSFVDYWKLIFFFKHLVHICYVPGLLIRH